MGNHEAQRVQIRAGGQYVDFECLPGERILLRGLQEGFNLPYECASGTCGECRAEVVEGEVDTLWEDAPGAGYADRNQVLMCQSTARRSPVLRLRREIDRKANSAIGSPVHQSGWVRALEVIDRNTATIEIEVPHPFRFFGGQFVLIGIPDIEGYRAYSIANYPADDGILRFVVRRKDGGQATARIFDRTGVGDPVTVFGPLGRACLAPEQDKDLVLVAGGSGISAAMGVIEHALSVGHLVDHKASLFFGVRSANDAFFAKMLQNYVRKSTSNMSITVAFSEGSVPESLHEKHPLLNFETGNVHEVAETGLPETITGTTAFLAGPTPMVDASVRMLLLGKKISPTNIRYDKFN